MSDKEEIAFAMVAVFKGGEDLQPSLIRRSRRDLIEHAKKTFFGGGKDWTYIKRQGWRIQKIKIIQVKS